MTLLQTSTGGIDRRARAELLSGVGAAVLGVGLGLLLKDHLAGLALPLLLVGATVHGLAMYQKHHLDAWNGVAGPRWASWAYWACWQLLLLLGIYLWWSRS